MVNQRIHQVDDIRNNLEIKAVILQWPELEKHLFAQLTNLLKST